AGRLAMATITHHGGTQGVTGSCHRLTFDDGQAVLIDCGLLQGDDRGVDGASSAALAVTFDLSAVRAVVLTHSQRRVRQRWCRRTGLSPWCLSQGSLDEAVLSVLYVDPLTPIKWFY
ncbi:MAG: hypothetical protein ACO2YV_14160, partial [Pseudomonadales bacterium]